MHLPESVWVYNNWSSNFNRSVQQESRKKIKATAWKQPFLFSCGDKTFILKFMQIYFWTLPPAHHRKQNTYFGIKINLLVVCNDFLFSFLSPPKKKIQTEKSFPFFPSYFSCLSHHLYEINRQKQPNPTTLKYLFTSIYSIDQKGKYLFCFSLGKIHFLATEHR